MPFSAKKFVKSGMMHLWEGCGQPSGLAPGSAVIVTWHSLRRDDDAPDVRDVPGPASPHGFSVSSPAPAADSPIRIPVSLFHEHLDCLEQNFRFARLDRILNMSAEEREAAGRLCAVTFDDGWADTRELALPVLDERGIPATVFVCPGLTDSGRDFWWERLAALRRRFLATPPEDTAALEADLEVSLGSALGSALGATFGAALGSVRDSAPDLALDPAGPERFPGLPGLFRLPEDKMLAAVKRLPFPAIDDLVRLAGDRLAAPRNGRAALTWDEIRALREAGWHIGSHTLNHAILPVLGKEAAEREIAGSLAALKEKLGDGPYLFSYPNGDHGPREEEMVRAAGYAGAVCGRTGVVPPRPGNPFSLPRIDSAGKTSGQALLFAVFRASIRGKH